jgi:hypothetical protein
MTTNRNPGDAVTHRRLHLFAISLLAVRVLLAPLPSQAEITYAFLDGSSGSVIAIDLEATQPVQSGRRPILRSGQPVGGVTGVAVNPLDGSLYLGEFARDAENRPNHRLLRAQPFNWTAETIGHTNIVMSAMAFDSEGTLYAVGRPTGAFDTNLFAVDIGTGVATPLMGLPGISVGALAYDPEEAVLAYMTREEASSTSPWIFATIDSSLAIHELTLDPGNVTLFASSPSLSVLDGALFGTNGSQGFFVELDGETARLQLGPSLRRSDLYYEPFGTPITPRGLLALGASEGACVPGSTTLCLNRDRFSAQVRWLGEDGTTNVASVQQASADSGRFWFFDPSNIEVQVKVLDGCSTNSHYWVFGSASTDVAYTLEIRDTSSGSQRQYHHDSGSPSLAITDVQAFATCP